MNIYTPRLTKPNKGNKYYNTKSNGGYSNAIVGKCKNTGKADTDCSVLANCVGYAFGRFNEIGNYNSCKYLKPVNAENFPEYATGCKTGNVPKLGAVICWQKGATLKSSDGCGHVAIVENIISDTEILISQSGYNSTVFWTEKCTKKNGQWLCSWMGTAYKFRCFIYNPAVTDTDRPSLKKGDKSIYVKELQEKLNTLGSSLATDSSFGPLCETAVKNFQKNNKLTVDGIVGKATYEAIDKAIEKLKKPEGVIDLSLLLDGKEVTVWATNIESQNYIRLVDLQDIGLVKSVSYNKTKKMPEVKTK